MGGGLEGVQASPWARAGEPLGRGHRPRIGSCGLQMFMKPNTASLEGKRLFSCWNLFFPDIF